MNEKQTFNALVNLGYKPWVAKKLIGREKNDRERTVSLEIKAKANKLIRNMEL